jgi:hypothetical protein
MSGGGWLADVKAHDKSCRASRVVDCCKYTTVIPESEKDWWNSNRSEYSPVVGSHENGILLRAELRESFEAGAWVPMPTEDGRVMLYVVQPSLLSSQFVQLWHAREMQPLIGVDRYFLFIRVAYAILCLQCDLRIPDGEGTELIADWQTGKLKKPEGLEWEITSKLRGIHGGPVSAVSYRCC